MPERWWCPEGDGFTLAWPEFSLHCNSGELRIFGKIFSLRALRLCASHGPKGFGSGFATPGLRAFALRSSSLLNGYGLGKRQGSGIGVFGWPSRSKKSVSFRAFCVICVSHPEKFRGRGPQNTHKSLSLRSLHCNRSESRSFARIFSRFSLCAPVQTLWLRLAALGSLRLNPLLLKKFLA